MPEPLSPESRTPAQWAAELATALGLSPDDVDVTLLLDLAREAAHTVARPAAPVTTFLVGLAAGRAGGRSADVASAVARTRELLGES